MSKDAQTAGTAAPAKSKKGFTTILLVAVLLIAGGGGAYWWFVARPAASTGAAAAEPAPPPPPEPGIVPLEAFVVNLADPGGTRYLRVSLSLLVESAEQAKELEEEAVVKMQVRSAILELLALQTADRLTTADGKAELKTAIAERVSHGAGHLKVTDVLFSEFIVQ